MDSFDLFVMIFLTMDHYWDVYTEFCDFLGDREITVDNSYQIAVEYVDRFGEHYVKNAFNWIDEDKWIKKCTKYLESDG